MKPEEPKAIKGEVQRKHWPEWHADEITHEGETTQRSEFSEVTLPLEVVPPVSDC